MKKGGGEEQEEDYFCSFTAQIPIFKVPEQYPKWLGNIRNGIRSNTMERTDLQSSLGASLIPIAPGDEGRRWICKPQRGLP